MTTVTVLLKTLSPDVKADMHQALGDIQIHNILILSKATGQVKRWLQSVLVRAAQLIKPGVGYCVRGHLLHY